MKSQLLNNKVFVTAMMMEYPQTRDSDKLLWIYIMRRHYGLDQIRSIDDFYHWFMDEKTPNMESIRRIRQKIQQERPELRGELYGQRHKEAEAVRAWSLA